MVYNRIKHILPHFQFKGQFVSVEELKSGKVTVEKFIERVELRMKNTDSWLK